MMVESGKCLLPTEKLSDRKLILSLKHHKILASYIDYFIINMFKARTIIHYSLHFLAPGIIAGIFFPEQWIVAWLIMIATMLVDGDHLFSKPIFDPN